jgi:hypothetical protein
MERSRRDIEEGLIVRTAEGEKLGRIIGCEQGSFIIEKGIFFPTDYVARISSARPTRRRVPSQIRRPSRPIRRSQLQQENAKAQQANSAGLGRARVVSLDRW